MANRITLATMFGVGLVKKAPGTAGSAVAALLAYFILTLPFSMILLGGGTFLFTIWGTRSTTRYMATHGVHDPKEVVIDELAGQWLTIFLFAKFWPAIVACEDGGRSDLDGLSYEWAVLLCFLAFRLFDILKPWPISWADRKVKGGFGVMFDDLLAAIPAAIFAMVLTIVLNDYIVCK